MNWLTPDWPAPASVRACVTTREGGVSEAPFDSLNLGDHVDDRPEAVAENRRRLTEHFSIQPAWLQQVHGTAVAHADPGVVATADASWTATPGIACTAMTADCLPALSATVPVLASRRLTPVGAVWRREYWKRLSIISTLLRRTYWSGSARPLARKPLKSARKYAKSLSINCRKRHPPSPPATMLASSWPTSTCWRACAWLNAVSLRFMAAVSAL